MVFPGGEVSSKQLLAIYILVILIVWIWDYRQDLGVPAVPAGYATAMIPSGVRQILRVVEKGPGPSVQAGQKPG